MAQEQSRRPGTPAWKAAGGTSKASSGPQYAWKPPEQQAQSHWGRRFKLLAAVGGGLVCVAVIGLLIYYLRPHQAACLVVVGNDPAADLDRLDAPLDVYGWHGGRRLAELVQTSSSRSELPLRLAGDVQPADSLADLPGFLQTLERREYNPLIVYFGLHGGADPSGPFLFTPGGGRVYVRSLIEGFAGPRLRDKKVMLLFDTARLAPDPALGVLFPGFVRALKGLEAEGLFANVPNLVAICATDAGERGWDAEEWATTGFAEMLRHGLGGEAAASKGSIITAASLFDYVQRQTQSWSSTRPTPQTPILLPAAGGRERAAQIDLTVTAGAEAAVDWPEAAPFAPPKPLTDHWAACKALESGTPSPAVYTPRLWRRYRELLLRYEQLLRAGDESTRLSDRLEKLEQELRDSRRLRLAGNVEPTSWRNSLPLPAALGMTLAAVPDASFNKIWAAPEADWDNLCKKALVESSGGDPEQLRARFYDYLLRKAIKATEREDIDRAARLMMRPAFTEAGWRPAEAHLLVMTRQFFDAVKSAEPPPPKLWTRALEVRRLAEQATLGVKPATAGHPYSEQLWTVLEKPIVEADIRRRDGEDWLFASAGQDRAGQELDAAAKQYEDALRKADSLQAAYAARDEALADLPLLTRWVALQPAKAADSRTETVHDLWLTKVHPLARRLEAGGSGLAGESFNQLAKDVRDGVARLKDGYVKRCGYLSGRANLDLQEDWEQVEQVLAVPPMLIEPNVRQALVESNRRRAINLSDSWRKNRKPFAPPSATDADALRDARRAQARQWGELAAAVLGDIAKEQQSDRKGTLHSAEGLRIDLTRFSAENWQATADEMGDHVGRHWRVMGDPDAPQKDDAEFRSRFAIAFREPDPDKAEPATVNRQKRWQKLLAGLALRTVRDHWYYENPEVPRPTQYFVAAADRYLNDGARCSSPAATDKRTAGPDDDARRVQELRNSGPLQLAPVDFVKPGQHLAWTTENQRTLTFAVKAKSGPGGYVTFWPEMGQSASLVVRGEDATRQPLRLESKPGQPVEATRDMRVDADRKAVTGSVTLTARGYFRGQWPTSETTIDMNRTPELIVARATPPNDAGLAVRAGDDFDAGAIAIVLDFSGSMQELPGPNGKPLIGPDKQRVRNWKDANSKNQQAVRMLREVLLGLPPGTPISLRLFGYDYEDGARRGMPDAQLARMTKDKLIYPDADHRGEGKVTWTRGDPNSLDEAIIGPLAQIEPQGHTPLLRTMIKAKGDFPPKYQGAKTMLVLTDGMDNLEDPNQLKSKLEAEFKDSDISIQMVFFRVDEDELVKARKQFEDVAGFSAPGAISVVEENSKLKERVDQALRPKLRLTDSGVPVKGMPPGGLPADRLTAPLNGLWWSPKFDAGSYVGEVLPKSRQIIHFRGGDRLLVRLTKDGPGVRFSRDLLADDLRLKGRVSPRGEGDDWVLGLPYYHAAPTERDEPLRLTATLESPRGLSPGHNGNLEQTHPEFVWWEVTPLSGKPPKTLRMTERSRLPAPAWTLLAEGWPGGANGYKPATVRAWAAQYPPPPSCQVQFSTAAVAAGQARTVEPSKDGTVQVFASIEDRPLRVDTDPKNDFETTEPKTEKCLVVRVLYEHDKPVFVRPVGVDFQAAEHRYFPPSDAVTAVFGPVNSKDDLDAKLRGKPLVLDLISVDRFKAEHKPVVLAMPDPPSRTETPLVGPPSLGEKLEKAP